MPKDAETQAMIAEFYTKTVKLVAEMDFSTLEEFIKTHERIDWQNKAVLTAAAEEKRNRIAHLSEKDRQWLANGDEVISPDQVAVVKKARKQKRDDATKLADAYAILGIQNEKAIEKARNNEVTREFNASVHRNLQQKPVRNPEEPEAKPVLPQQQALMADAADIAIAGIKNGHSPDLIAQAVRTAAHIARKIQPTDPQPEMDPEVKKHETQTESAQTTEIISTPTVPSGKKVFDPSQFFPKKG